ncbi:type II toxin-antitoxin system PemK/MazF family toxin, partial [Rhodococcus sp. NPDC058514]
GRGWWLTSPPPGPGAGQGGGGGAAAGPGPARPRGGPLDRVLDVPEAGIRREGAILDQRRFDQVAARLRSDFSWS